MWSVITQKCPKCNQGNMFSTLFTMSSSCSHCGQDFEIEPGFYLGAMYISYFFTSFFLLSSSLVLRFYFEFDLLVTLAIASILSVLLIPIAYRLSRRLWLGINL
ncbi:MAG: DUF983 domain-containing protein [Chitinophagales bacterium]|nr:DUF983 domain-containing protein [Chitinophagales bacterium]